MEIILDALLDSFKLLPFLIVIYFLLEVIEHNGINNLTKYLSKGKLTPLWGSLIGIVPQCGFSVMASKLFNKKIITHGTIIAIFIASSDEAIPILLSDANSIPKMLPLVLIKLIFAIVMGFSVDLIININNKTKCKNNKFSNIDSKKEYMGGKKLYTGWKKLHSSKAENCYIGTKNTDSKNTNKDTHIYCKTFSNYYSTSTNSNKEYITTTTLSENTNNISENINTNIYTDKENIYTDIKNHSINSNENNLKNDCNCNSLGKKDKLFHYIFNTLKRSIVIFLYIFIFNIILGFIIEGVGEENFFAFLNSNKYLQPFFASLVGLIPNCASSVFITKLYVSEGLSLAATVSGLSVNAGIAYIFLFKKGNNMKNALFVTCTIFISSNILGLLITLIQNVL